MAVSGPFSPPAPPVSMTRTAMTAVPLDGAGHFPADPFFTWVGSTNNLTWTDSSSDELLYYLVGAAGSDGEAGLIEHYGK